jgi:superfamily II DNA or RNA helicase
MLNDTDIQGSYSTEEDDLANDFFKPAFGNSSTYSRIAGHFSSSVFEIFYEQLEDFLENGIKIGSSQPQIRLIVSHKLRRKDTEAADNAYANRPEEILEEDLNFDINEFLNDKENLETLKLFSYLIEHRILEIKVGILKEEASEHEFNYVHEKTGIFSDGTNTLSFRGGVNESMNGVNNFDGFDTNRSWIKSVDSDQKIEKHMRIFEKLWSNDSKKLDIYNLPKAIKSKLIEYSTSDDKFRAEIKKRKSTNKRALSGIVPRAHQEEAIKIWKKNKYRAVLEHCTGSGKTKLAIIAMTHMLLQKKNILILVPRNTILEQWVSNIEQYIPQVNILKCSGNYNWKDSLRRCIQNTKDQYAIIATISTATLSEFKDRCSEAGDLFLIADECHMLWPPVYNTVLSEIPWKDNPRLALSATPYDTTFPDSNPEANHENDDSSEEESQRGKINPIEFFGGIKKNNEFFSNHIITLKDGIDKGWLSKYEYYVTPIHLTRDEMTRYREAGKDIARAASKKPRDQRAFKAAVAKRNKVIKIAQNKRTKCLEILKSNKWGRHDLSLTDHHWLVYVGPGKTVDGGNELQSEIEHMRRELWDNLDRTISSYVYDGSTKHSEREGILNRFQQGGGIILACQMLDEGVDIPELSRAIVMASSENSRVFIQRRGRLLRKDDRLIEDKPDVNLIWDIIVLPDLDLLENSDELEFYEKVINKECKRALEFCKDAENSKDMESKIKLLQNKYLYRLE